MAASFLSHVMYTSRNTCAEKLSQIHIVFDQYFEQSIKNDTREKRTSCSKANIHHVLLYGTVPKDWRLFLSRDENKASLAECHSNYIKQNGQKELKQGQKSFLNGGAGEKAYAMFNREHAEDISDKERCAQLYSNQEETDTRIVLHAIFVANNGVKNLVIQSPDTDVLVLLIHYHSAIYACEIYFATGQARKHASLKRYIPIHTLYDILYPHQHVVMLPIYCLTGCDTVSAFYGHGKATAFRLIMQKAEQFEVLKTLGTRPYITSQEITLTMRLVCKIYGYCSDSLNDLRCKLASDRKARRVGKKLPPTEDSFLLHLLRAVYQLMIWIQADQGYQDLPDPTEY